MITASEGETLIKMVELALQCDFEITLTPEAKEAQQWHFAHLKEKNLPLTPIIIHPIIDSPFWEREQESIDVNATLHQAEQAVEQGFGVEWDPVFVAHMERPKVEAKYKERYLEVGRRSKLL